MKPSDLATRCEPFSRTALSTVILLLIAGCALFQQRPVTPISAVIESAQSGASGQQLVAEIRTARTIYVMRGSDFPRLAELGVPEAALDELQQSFFAEVEFLTRRWFSRGATGGPSSNFPQPLDLDNLSGGGNGMGPTDNLGRITHGSRPQGVPQWVPPFPPLTGPTMPANAVVEMTNSGMSTEEIVAVVLGSRVDVLYAPSGAFSSRFRTAALTGSMFARFAEQGVAPEVLDALQAVYISQHVERSRKTGSRGTGGANS
jgi:hypothetical protein